MPYSVQVEFRTPSSFLVAYSVNLSRGGLWVDARALDDQGVFTGVSADLVDNSHGSSGP